MTPDYEKLHAEGVVVDESVGYVMVSTTKFTPELEAVVALMTPVSAISSRETFHILGITGDVRGQRHLDIAGGCSDHTAELLARGAEAYSVDPKYGDIEAIIAQARKHIEGSPAANAATETIALQRFIESASQDPSHYRTGYATALDFPNDHFDRVSCFRFMLSHMNIQPDMLIAAVAEGIRVLKPGGTFTICPTERKEPLNGFAQANELCREMLHVWLDSNPRIRHYGKEFRLNGKTAVTSLEIEKLAR
ncbi:class I SAM-dependent methyltransferase [Candidatus Curtissbacteria bacterium]|nr:class I SAM-dependent methyltransferase [Candidatus Curtissbacteria bacterium]